MFSLRSSPGHRYRCGPSQRSRHPARGRKSGRIGLKQQYSFPDGSLLYCRTCEGLRPHKAKDDRTGVYCTACLRGILTAEIVATYSADEHSNPAPIMLPTRLLPPGMRLERVLATVEETV